MINYVMFVCIVLLFKLLAAVVQDLSLMDTSMGVHYMVAVYLIFATLAMSLLEVIGKEDVFLVVLGQVLHHIAQGFPPLHPRLQQIQVQLKNKEYDSTNNISNW